MTEIEQLRRTLIDHEDLAVDTTEIVVGARRGAVRIRRRRRRAHAAMAALAVIAVVGAPAAIAHLRSAVDAAHAARSPFALTVDLAADSGYARSEYGVVGTTQYIVVRPAGSEGTATAVVEVHDPGTFDPTVLLGGTSTTVQGHQAYYAPYFTPRESAKAGQDYPNLVGVYGLINSGPAALGWRDASGAWIVVDEGGTEADLYRVADAIRIGDAGRVIAPYHLTYVPSRLAATFASVVDGAGLPGDQGSIIGFGGAPDWRTMGSNAWGATLLSIRAAPVGGGGWERPTGPPTMTIDGYDVWYSADGTAFDVPDRGSLLIFNAGDCAVTIMVADRSRIPLDELARLITGARFTSCSDPAAWVSPLP